MENQIFISYRRTGGDTTAKLICETLKVRGFSVFYDFDTLKGGFFDTRILDAIEKCNDVVLVLPPHALDRCVNEDDWVRQEIRHALQNGKNIIPVMLDGFAFPAEMPDDIAEITRYNGLHFSMEYFDAAIDKIVEKLSDKTKKQQGRTPRVKKPRAKATQKSLLAWVASHYLLLINLVLTLGLLISVIFFKEARHYLLGSLIGVQFFLFFIWIRLHFPKFNTSLLYVFLNGTLTITCIPLVCFTGSLRAYAICLSCASTLTSVALWIIGFLRTTKDALHDTVWEHNTTEPLVLLLFFHTAALIALIGIALLLNGAWTQRIVLGGGILLVSILGSLAAHYSHNDTASSVYHGLWYGFYLLTGILSVFIKSTTLGCVGILVSFLSIIFIVRACDGAADDCFAPIAISVIVLVAAATFFFTRYDTAAVADTTTALSRALVLLTQRIGKP